MKRCGAKKRTNGKPCRKPAGWGTDHRGEGRCRIHGGANPCPAGGRYSTIKTRRLGPRIQEFLDDPDPLNLEPEAAAIRALVAGFLERFDEMEEALLAWNAAEQAGRGPQARPQRVPCIFDASGLLEAVSRVVEKIHKQRTSQAVTLDQVAAWFQAIAGVVAKHVHDPDTLRRIERDCGLILPSA